MKNQADIYTALLAGETLISMNNITIKLDEDGDVKSNNMWVNGGFSVPKNWGIYKEKKWYENIPDGGVLCWADVCVVIIVGYEADKYPCKYQVKDAEDATITRWTAHAEPLTKQEIQVFIDNAPEKL